MNDPLRSDPSPEEEARRREALERLAAAAHRVGLPRERLAALLRKLHSNEAETRRFLADEVYGVSEEEIDQLLKRRFEQ